MALAYAGSLTVLAMPAAAQELTQDTDQSTERIVVVGSSIKRLASETSLPVSIITRAQIEKSGATSVEDLLKRVSANSAAVSDSTQGKGYATSNANMRGLGANSTLVLLNGRRLSNHPFGSVGGTAAVDLNSIPFTAIERIEVLRDGASAVYGSDAIGGVINFITRKNYRDGEVSIHFGDTQERIGGTEKGGSIAVGFGDLASDRYNVLVTGNFQKNTRLRAIDQKLYERGIQEVPGSELPSSSAPFPGYIDGLVNPGAYPGANLGPNYTLCGTPTSYVTNDGKTPNGKDQLNCQYVYPATLDNLPDQDKKDLFARATFRLSEDHQLFIEGSYADNHNTGRIAPTPIKYTFGPFNAAKFDFEHVLMPVTSPYYPRALLTSLGYTVPATGMAEIGLRAVPLGNRINDNTNSQLRLVVGLTGTIDGWDYDTAVNVSRAKGRLSFGGYVQEDRMLAGLATGLINPFGPSGPEGDKLWNAALMDGDMRSSTSTTTEIDFKGSKELMQMAGGKMALALGGSARQEKADDRPLNADYAAGKNIGGDGTVPATVASRNISAVFAELSLPFAKGWEASLAGRYDHYSDFGSTFNPRVSMRFQPTRQVMFRAAAGTGFRAPTLWDVNSPASFSVTPDNIADPECPTDVETDARCGNQVPTRATAAATLKPELSRQFSYGVVLEPARNLSMTLDYWNIQKRDQIGVIAAESLLYSEDLMSRFASRVKRSADGYILYVETPVDNLGNLRTSGWDLDVRDRLDLGDAGRLTLGIAGTYVSKYDAQKYAGGEYGHFAGTGGDGSVPPAPRWQHTASAEWQYHDVSVVLENVYTSGWLESADSVNANIYVDESHRVKASNRFNLSTAYKGVKDLTVRIGVRNLFNKLPPYVASPSYGSDASGYAASFTDPRGRFWYAGLSYKFK